MKNKFLQEMPHMNCMGHFFIECNISISIYLHLLSFMICSFQYYLGGSFMDLEKRLLLTDQSYYEKLVEIVICSGIGPNILKKYKPALEKHFSD